MFKQTWKNDYSKVCFSFSQSSCWAAWGWSQMAHGAFKHQTPRDLAQHSRDCLQKPDRLSWKTQEAMLEMPNYINYIKIYMYICVYTNRYIWIRPATRHSVKAVKRCSSPNSRYGCYPFHIIEKPAFLNRFPRWTPRERRRPAALAAALASDLATAGRGTGATWRRGGAYGALGEHGGTKNGWQWVSNMGYIFSWTLFSFIFLFLSKAN